MKKFLVTLLALCLALSCMSVWVLADEEAAPAKTNGADTLIGMFYNQGECGYGTDFAPEFGNEPYKTTFDWTIADQLAKTLDGTDRVPFYAYTPADNEIFKATYFDAFAQYDLKYEMNLAYASGVDFVAFRYYSGSGKDNGASSESNLKFMNKQLKDFATCAGGQDAELNANIKFTVVLDGDFCGKDAKSSVWKRECNDVIATFTTSKAFLTNSEGRPVIYILWNDSFKDQVENLNEYLEKAIEKGIDKVKLEYPAGTKFYVVALNAPSEAEATAAGADAISWYDANGKDGEAYTSMTGKVEANWAGGSKVIPNVVTGSDKTPLVANPIEVSAVRYTKEDVTVRYSRKATDADKAAKATPDELIAHIQNAINTANKPAELKAVMIYAWDDFAGGAYLCPTKTDTKNVFEMSFLKAMRNFFYGTEEGFPELPERYTAEATPVPSEAPADVTPAPEGEATPAPATDDPGKSETGKSNLPLILGICGGVAVVAIIVIVAVVASKKKKTPETK